MILSDLQPPVPPEPIAHRGLRVYDKKDNRSGVLLDSHFHKVSGGGTRLCRVLIRYDGALEDTELNICDAILCDCKSIQIVLDSEGNPVYVHQLLLEFL
jgi:hypothetical protein